MEDDEILNELNPVNSPENLNPVDKINDLLKTEGEFSEENLDALLNATEDNLKPEGTNPKEESPINPEALSNEEVVKTSEIIESGTPEIESVSTQINPINPSEESKPSTINNITNNNTVISQSNIQNNVDNSTINESIEVEDVAPIINDAVSESVNQVDETVQTINEENKDQRKKIDLDLQLKLAILQDSLSLQSDEDRKETENYLNKLDKKLEEDSKKKEVEIGDEDLELASAYFGTSTVNEPLVEEKKEGEVEAISNAINESTGKSAVALTESVNSSKSEIEKFVGGIEKKLEEDSKKTEVEFGKEDMEIANLYFGSSPKSPINQPEGNKSEEVVEDVAPIINPEVEETAGGNPVLSNSGNVEVNKTPVVLDNKVAPINTVNNTTAKSDQIVNVEKEKKEESQAVENTSQVQNVTNETVVSNQATTEGASTNIQSSSIGGSQSIDLSEVSMRLRRLEDILMSPLEVKVIN